MAGEPALEAGSAAGVYVFDVPGFHPTPLNKLMGAHWGTASKRKKADRQMIWAYAKQAGVPAATVKRSVEIIITLEPKQRACDGDAYYKSGLDALVQCALLKDDNRQWCEILPAVFKRGSFKNTRIILRDCPCS